MSTRTRLKEDEYDYLCEYRKSVNKKFVPKDEFRRCGRKTFYTRLSDAEFKMISCYRDLKNKDLYSNFKNLKDSPYLMNKCNTTYENRVEEVEEPLSKSERKRNVLVIGDLHAPFTKVGYLDFCKSMYVKYKCTDVVFLGDILDCHFSSFHETDPDGMGAQEELYKAKEQIAEFYKAFPVAKVALGNHDILPNRKAFSSGLSSSWIRTVDEVLDVPNWEFSEEFVIDGVLYTHGVGRQARVRVMQELISVVQGHFHSKTYYETFTSERKFVFALQIGCGLDRRSYAAAYAKHFQKPQINVGIVLDNGRYAVIEHMEM